MNATATERPTLADVETTRKVLKWLLDTQRVTMDIWEVHAELSILQVELPLLETAA